MGLNDCKECHGRGIVIEQVGNGYSSRPALCRCVKNLISKLVANTVICRPEIYGNRLLNKKGENS